MLAYLICAARGLPVAYISHVHDWLHAAGDGKDDAFLLETFWRQNVDFWRQNVDRTALPRRTPCAPSSRMLWRTRSFKHSYDVMKGFRDAIQKTPVNGAGAGIIIDGAHHINKAARKVRRANAAAEAQMGGYSALRWYRLKLCARVYRFAGRVPP